MKEENVKAKRKKKKMKNLIDFYYIFFYFNFSLSFHSLDKRVIMFNGISTVFPSEHLSTAERASSHLFRYFEHFDIWKMMCHSVECLSKYEHQLKM